MNSKSFWSFFSRKNKGAVLETPYFFGDDLPREGNHLSVVYNARTQIADYNQLSPDLSDSAQKKDFISIVIIAYNEEKYLPALLASLEVQSFKDFELIIVDSNSTDRTTKAFEQFFTRFEEIRLIQLGCTKGPAYARNQGASYAKYSRLLFLDADTLLKKDFLQLIVNEMKTRRTDVASCRIRVAENGLVSNLGAYFLNMFMVGLKPFYTSAYGACLISTKNIHNRIGGFREDLAVCEDCNYIKRSKLLNAKYHILKPFFYTSDRRAKNEGSMALFLKYLKIHSTRIILRKEILNGEINYNYGDF